MKETEKVIDPITGEEVVKPEEETSEEETTPPEEKEKETPPPSEGVKPEVLYDEFGVPLQNRTKEYERKNLELQAEIRGLKDQGKQEQADELEAFLKERKDPDIPLTNEEIKKLTNLIGKRIVNSVSRLVGPMMASQRVVDAQIARLKGMVSFEPKAEALLRSNLNEVSPEALVGNPEVISNKIYDMTIGQLTREGRLGKSKQPKKTPGPNAPKIEDPGTPPAKGKKAPSEAEKKEAENKHMSVEALRRVKAKRAQGKKDKEKK